LAVAVDEVLPSSPEGDDLRPVEVQDGDDLLR
jgi:hypothetical protein